MRRLVVIIVVVLLGHSVASIGGESSSAQELGNNQECVPGGVPSNVVVDDDDSYYWEGVCQPIPLDDAEPVPIDVDRVMQPYAVGFAEIYAAVPDAMSGDFDPEFMVVIVREGTFALDVRPGGRVVVYGNGNAIPLRMPFENMEPYYGERPDEDVLMDDGSPCVQACEIPPGTVVELNPGDLIVAEEGAICVYCLLKAGSDSGNETGLLEVFVPRDDETDSSEFSWIDSWERAQRGEIPFKRSDATPAALGWAYFNPATRCKDG